MNVSEVLIYFFVFSANIGEFPYVSCSVIWVLGNFNEIHK